MVKAECPQMTIKDISSRDLIREARESGHSESYRVLRRADHYRIGAGAVLKPSGHANFYVEVLIGLCAPSTTLLPDLERKLHFAKELEGRRYSLDCQDGCYLVCEKTLSEKDLAIECDEIDSLAMTIFSELTREEARGSSC
jgi:hypothetical protein